MLVAREQLNLIKTLVAKIGAPSSIAKSVAEIQALQIAIIAMLRSVGHVLQKVDCEAPEDQAWLAEQWKAWRKEPIFVSFIEYNRNLLLKEFRGLSKAGAPELDGFAVVATGSPGGGELQTWMNPESWRTADGEPMMAKLNEAIAFWDRCLRDAESNFAKHGI